VRAYRRFIADGHKLGHNDSYYQTIDQRFLGDEKFIERVLHRAPHAEIRPAGRKLGFEKLLHAVAEVYGTAATDLIAPGRQRTWTGARAQLAYLSRTWCGMKATEIARRLKRDPSMVSRLCATYESDRDLRIEKNIAEVIRKQLTTQA
jgi:chromosomal replication initiation ATPase DnaA